MRNFVILALFLVALGHSEAFLFSTECNGSEYDSKEKICCGDQLYTRTNNTKCCHGEIIDKRLHFCSHLGKIVKLISNCYGRYFDNKKDYCCAGTIYSIASGWRCCLHKQAYNPNTHTCTDSGEVIEKDTTKP